MLSEYEANLFICPQNVTNRSPDCSHSGITTFDGIGSQVKQYHQTVNYLYLLLLILMIRPIRPRFIITLYSIFILNHHEKLIFFLFGHFEEFKVEFYYYYYWKKKHSKNKLGIKNY